MILRAAIEENAYNRMKKVVKWYISGFYKKPKVRRINMYNPLHVHEQHRVSWKTIYASKRKKIR